jgi:FtsH-binding integral membrane protein
MAQTDRQTIAARGATTATIDAGLRSYMLQVYNYMTLGLGVTGVVAFFFNRWVMSSPQLIETFHVGPLFWVIALAPLALVLLLSFGVARLSLGAAQAAFWAFAVAMGLSLSSIFMVYAGESIARVFFITAGTFGAMSLWGYTTKRDLTSWGSFLFMGLIGLIIASVVNIFVASSALAFGISIIGVLVFVGLTAYDTQKIKEMYFEGDDTATMGKKTIMGALSLYLDFINLFLMLLRLFGNRE